MTMLRDWIDDAREFPATTALGVLWIVVFLLIVKARIDSGPVPTMGAVLLGNLAGGVAHRFGDMTVDELARGQVWRAVTSTFVHYNLLHLAMNLYGLYILGSLLESWYGSGTLVVVYLLTGGGGNLLSGLARSTFRMNPGLHSGGGSTVVLGLVALCAVVGWRSKTRRGDYLRGQMVGALVFTAFLGQVLPIIDNWGHAGGALMGALVGFAHRPLVRAATRPVTRWAGAAAAMVLLICGAAQLRENRVEDTRLQLDIAQRVEMSLPVVEVFYRQATLRSQFEHAPLISKSVYNPKRTRPRARNVPPPLSIIDSTDLQWRIEQARYLALVSSIARELHGARDAEEIGRVRRLLQKVFDRAPTPANLREFRANVASLLQSARRNRAAAQTRYAAISRNLW